MKVIVTRFIAFFIAVTIGVILFAAFLFVGNKSKGPLQDLFIAVNSNVAKAEKNLLNSRESRNESIIWFNQFRNNKAVINNIDTILLGAYDDASYESFEHIIALEDSLQAKLPIISIYTAWGSNRDQVFPLLKTQAIYDLGSIPMITWEPWLNDFDPKKYTFNADAANKNKGGMRAIVEGKYDEYIDKWASEARKFGLPFYLRWGHEMNDPYRYPWGQQNNKPEDYVAAWQHLVERFRAAGANNAIWLWSPHPAYNYTEFYPGENYVDWIGLTALNYGTVATWSQWWSLDAIIGKAYKNLSTYKKPLMLTEFACLEVGGDRSTWYKEALSVLPIKYPKVKAVVFFHASNDKTTSYKELDWSFENDDKVLKSVREAIFGWR